jgi:hypothetical protein
MQNLSAFSQFEDDQQNQFSINTANTDPRLVDFEKYKKSVCNETITPSNVLTWWKENGNEFPFVSQVAMKLLSIPTSSASAERSFSKARDTITYRRNRLKSKNVNDLLTLKGFSNDYSESNVSSDSD